MLLLELGVGNNAILLTVIDALDNAVKLLVMVSCLGRRGSTSGRYAGEPLRNSACKVWAVYSPVPVTVTLFKIAILRVQIQPYTSLRNAAYSTTQISGAVALPRNTIFYSNVFLDSSQEVFIDQL